MPLLNAPGRMLSLRQRLLIWTAVPLLALVLANAWASYRAAIETTQSAYDRLLVTAAHALADMIWLEDGQLQVSLPHAALELYAGTAPDSARSAPERSPLQYRVSFLNGAFLAGDEALPFYEGTAPETTAHGARMRLYDQYVQGSPMRMVALWQPVESAQGLQYVIVQVGEYADYRFAIGRHILLQTLLHQSALLLLVLAVLWLASTWGLRPLHQLAHKLEQRSAHDLEPLSLHTPTREMQPLVHAFNGLLERIQHAQMQQQRFVADASHQLRTPLSVLKLHTDAGLQGVIPMHEALQDIAHTTRRTSRVVHQLLMWNRAQHTCAAPATAVDLHALLQEVVLEQSRLIADKHLDFNLQAESMQWHGQTWMVQEVVMNLLSNAIRHTGEGGALGIDLQTGAAGIAIRVWDSGPGLSRHMAAQLFTPFVSEASQGVGLGLTISRDLAAACGGHLEICNRTSEDGLQVLGLNATLWLPAPQSLP